MTDPTYSNGWARARRYILRRDAYRCQLRLAGCEGKATTVDHIISPKDAPHLRLTPSNLRASCAHCNYSRGATDQQGRYRHGVPPPTRTSAPPSREW